MPVASFVMVFHRVTPFLAPAIASILRQSLEDLELVLVDNGTAAQGEVLGLAATDRRVKIVRLVRNEGIPSGHNAGIAAAQGEFVVLLDYDDIALPDRAARQVEFLRSNPAAGLVSSRVDAIDDAGQRLGSEFSLLDGAAQHRYVEFAAPVVTPAYAGRRSVFQQCPYRTQFTLGADFDFLTRASEITTLGAVREILLQYRRHSGQTTIQGASRIALERCVVRLLAARRRAGRSEGSDWLGFLAGGKTPAEAVILRDFGRRLLAENLGVQAAYHARRSFAVERTPSSFATAVRIAAQAMQRDRANRGGIARMFMRGPVAYALAGA